MSEARQRFGKTAVATPANALSAGRLVAGPIFGILIGAIGPVSWVLWVIWTVLACTDGLDGHLARRQGTTSSGAFLDPLADKFLVLSALGALGVLGIFSWWPIGLIASREVAMSLYRTFASRRRVSVPASALAKWKTLVQDVAIGCAFWPIVARSHIWVARDLLWLAMALTIVSGLQYYLAARRILVNGAPPSAPVLHDRSAA